MKFSKLAASVLSIGLLSLAVGGCSTDKPGVTNVAGSYHANIAAAPDKVTVAARKAVEEMKLTNVASVGTKIDGKVTARNAQNDQITIDIEESGENVSKVSVRVGAGDESTSMLIIDKIKSHLTWFGSSSKSTAPAMSNMAGTYSAMLDAAPDKATGAAKKAVEDMKLTSITNTSTKIDGKVTAKTAQDDAVVIDIEQAGDQVSKVSIRVGALGDQAISRQILDHMNASIH